MVKMKTNWASPAGEKFIFEYEVTRNGEASSVRNVNGTIHHHIVSNNEKAGGGDSSTSASPKKRQKGEELVGYLRGYEIRRGVNGNKLFHEHAGKCSVLFFPFILSLFLSAPTMVCDMKVY